MRLERAAKSFIPQTANDYQRNEGICQVVERPRSKHW